MLQSKIIALGKRLMYHTNYKARDLNYYNTNYKLVFKPYSLIKIVQCLRLIL